MSRKLAVFFPGIGYTVDKPLMYYSRKIAVKEGYEIKLLPYTGFPGKVLGDGNRMLESYRIAMAQTEEMLTDVDFEAYDEVLLIGKSIGTAVATEMASHIPVPVRFVLYTPLEETFRYPIEDAIVFTGLADPWVGKEKNRIIPLCSEREIPCVVIPDGNHSLESGEIQKDIESMKEIMLKTGAFLRGCGTDYGAAGKKEMGSGFAPAKAKG